jgi:hypothetical protein
LATAADVDHGAFPAVGGAFLGEGEEFFAFGFGEEVVYYGGEVAFVFWEGWVGFFEVDLVGTCCVWC